MTKGREMWDYLKLVLLGAAAVLMLYLASQSRDLAYTVAALIGLLSAVVAFVYSLRSMGGHPAPKTGYLDGPVRIGVILTAFWGVVGFLVGTWIAFLLAFPNLNFEWAQGFLNFGRLRPLHTSAVI
ncbi:MAG: cytochrome-c oxidase, cbb3-type subunit I, partial [Maritimibacter sp.]|nr:cytochrome-c oxidase, cbb3-type subunit I [Maritimibacter sp.]